jgi:hypothetical protein
VKFRSYSRGSGSSVVAQGFAEFGSVGAHRYLQLVSWVQLWQFDVADAGMMQVQP